MNLFVYGTLLVPSIWDVVSHFPNPESEQASLSGYAIYRVIDGDFPGIVETAEPSSAVTGRVIFDVTDEAMEKLDRYEGEFYVRKSLPVTTISNSRVDAFAYVVPAEMSHLLTEVPWDLEWFKDVALDRYWQAHFG